MDELTKTTLDLFLDYWARYCRLDNTHQAWLQTHAKVLAVKRGDVLFEPGDAHDYLFFVASGLLAAVAYDEMGPDGERLERRLLFLAAPSFSLLSTRNLYTAKQVEVEIQALRDGVVIRIPVPALREYHRHCPEAVVLINVIREKMLKQLRTLAGLMAIKHEIKRYRVFCERCEDLLRQTTQQEQADYLNISLMTIYRARGGKSR